MIKKPPLIVAPGGNLEKCKIAYLYGADAVYVSGMAFGLRKSADNFTLEELQHAVTFANSLNKKLYVVLNGFSHNEDLEELPAYIKALEKIQPHALIISDLGVLKTAQDYTQIPIHISTQASVTNRYTASFWKSLGATRIVLARECSLAESQIIKEKAGIEVELFIHGAMCASYSGKCVISNYTSGRDSNRGGCVQSCRHHYQILKPDSNQVDYSTHIMNAKDLMTINLLPKLVDAGIDALKIEGRMKSNHYLANTVHIYRQALDEILENKPRTPVHQLENALSKVSNRTFSNWGIEENTDTSSISYDWNGYEKQQQFIGTVKDQLNDGRVVLELKAPIEKNDTIYIQFPQKNGIKSWVMPSFETIEGTSLEKGNPNTLISFVSPFSIPTYSLVSKPL